MAFSHGNLFFLAFAGLIPLIRFLEKSEKNEFRLCWLGGWIFSAIVIGWFLANSPENWIQVRGWPIKFAPVFVWLESSLVLGLGWGIFGWLFFHLKKGGAQNLFAVPAAWIAGEYLKGWIFSVFSWGSGASIGPLWTFGNLGYAALPFLAASKLVGLYGLGFLVVFVNLALWKFFRGDIGRKKILAIAAAIIILPALGGYFYPSSGRTIRAAAFQLQPDSAADVGWLEEIAARKNSGGLLPADIVVAPENSLLFPNFSEKEILKSLLKPEGALISAGYRFNDEGQKEGRIVYQNYGGEVVADQRKTFLIPTGEFLPKHLEWLLRLIKPETIAEFQKTRGVSSGRNEERPVEIGGLKIAALSCSAIIAPVIYQTQAARGADALVNSASHEIIRNSGAFNAQIKMMVRFIAAANARPLIQSVRGGFSYIVDKNGRIAASTEKIQDDLISARVEAAGRLTPYSRFGEWVLMAAFLILVMPFLKKNDKIKS